MREHSLVRATVTPQIVTILSRYYQTGLNEALHRFYKSRTAANYADDETGLYGQSALYIAGMFIMEHDGSINRTRLKAAARSRSLHPRMQATRNKKH